eukprot:TRINITY_DN70163_c0_g1_i1.p1 TRINITY_DN70163_c0_g1~~TRINITY_DN70163_c0_g1_i1.p1  ORF type:complete len:457 (+),score=77.12 TRINITY_DN70163_c0_g1_i1:104-1474(+)
MAALQNACQSTYSVKELLGIRLRMGSAKFLAAADTEDTAIRRTPFLPLRIAPYEPEEIEHAVKRLERDLLANSSAGRLPPHGWARCRSPAKRDAIVGALRRGHMHVVFAMHPESDFFRANVQAVQLTATDCEEILRHFVLESDGCNGGGDAATMSATPPADAIEWLLSHGATARSLLRSGEQTSQVFARPPAVASTKGLQRQTKFVKSEKRRDFVTATNVSSRRELVVTPPGAPSSLSAVRLRCLLLLDTVGPAALPAVGSVIGCLDDPDPRVRRASADVIGHIGVTDGVDGSGAIIARLVALFHDVDVSVRTAAATALGRVGRSGVEASTALVEDADVEVAVLALRALEAAGPAAAAHAPLVAGQLRKDRHAGLRRAAAEALGAIGAESAVYGQALADLLAQDEDEYVREAGATALGRLGASVAPWADTILAAMEDDPNPHVRVAAGAALGLVLS